MPRPRPIDYAEVPDYVTYYDGSEWVPHLLSSEFHERQLSLQRMIDEETAMNDLNNERKRIEQEPKHD